MSYHFVYSYWTTEYQTADLLLNGMILTWNWQKTYFPSNKYEYFRSLADYGALDFIDSHKHG